MKLAYSTLGCPEWDFETIVSRAAEMGFGAVEIRGIGQELQTEKLPCFLPENRKRTRERLKENGISICCIGTSCCFHNPEALPAALEEGKRALDICAEWGIPAIRVFGDRLPPEETPAAVVKRAAGAIRELCSHAASSGNPARVLLEIHGDFCTPEILVQLGGQLADCPNFGWLWDIEHGYQAEQGFFPLYQAVRDRLVHVHIKDCRGGTTAVLPGTGELPIEAIVRRLLEDGYGGWFSFEWEKRWQPDIPEPETAFPAYVRFMRRIAGN